MQGPQPARGDSGGSASVRWFALKTKAVNRTRKILLSPSTAKNRSALWDPETISGCDGCDERMKHAKVFLESCGEGVDRWAARSPLIASQRLRPATRPWWSTAAAATMATR